MSVQEMREARKKPVVVFTKFAQNKDRYESGFFCFYEGEDNKYYEPRIEEYADIPYTNIVSFDCGGKDGVLEVRELIKKKSEYKSVKKAFFIDKDYFATEIEDDELFETPCYSVENFYTSRSAFERVLKRGFGINIHEEDFSKCVEDYVCVQEKFHEQMLEFNVWLKCQRKKEKCAGKRIVEMSEFRISEFFEKASITEVKNKKVLDADSLYTKFSQAHGIDDDEWNKEYNSMKACNQQQDFRGKFELWLFKKVIEDLRVKNKDNTYFTVHRECVKLDPNVDTLLQFSQFADTPDSLKEFLSKYKKAS